MAHEYSPGQGKTNDDHHANVQKPQTNDLDEVQKLPLSVFQVIHDVCVILHESVLF